MSHAKCLRVIGQAVESARLPSFELEKYGPQYMLWTDSVTETGEKALRNLLSDSHVPSHQTRYRSPKRVFCFAAADISRLDAQAQKQRKTQSFQPAAPDRFISRALRVLGDQLDRMQASAFRIEWISGSVNVDFQRSDGARNQQRFTFEEINKICLQPRLRRSSLYLFPPLDSEL